MSFNVFMFIRQRNKHCLCIVSIQKWKFVCRITAAVFSKPLASPRTVKTCDNANKTELSFEVPDQDA